MRLCHHLENGASFDKFLARDFGRQPLARGWATAEANARKRRELQGCLAAATPSAYLACLQVCATVSAGGGRGWPRPVDSQPFVSRQYV